MKKNINRFVNIATLVAICFAILFGFCAPTFSTGIKFIGDIYIKILKLLITPMIFVSMALFVLKREKTKKFIVGKSVALFLIMFITTFILTSVVVSIAKPGIKFAGETKDYTKTLSDLSFKAIAMKLIPTDFKKFILGDYIFFVIVFTLIASLIVSKTKAKEPCAKALTYCKKYIDEIFKCIVIVTPIAIVSLVSNLIVSNKAETFKIGLIYISFAYLMSVIAIIIVMIIPVWLIAKVNPIKYIRKVSKVWLITISTCSSAATLPYTIKCCNDGFGVDEKITDVVVPLGCTIHMCGGAISFSLLGLFVAQLTGVHVTIPMYIVMLLFATLINMAAPGIPGGGKVIGATYLSILGFPFETFFGLYISIYNFLDMAYTTLNVTGDISANIILDHLEKTKGENNTIKEKVAD